MTRLLICSLGLVANKGSPHCACKVTILKIWPKKNRGSIKLGIYNALSQMAMGGFPSQKKWALQDFGTMSQNQSFFMMASNKAVKENIIRVVKAN